MDSEQTLRINFRKNGRVTYSRGRTGLSVARSNVQENRGIFRNRRTLGKSTPGPKILHGTALKHAPEWTKGDLIPPSLPLRTPVLIITNCNSLFFFVPKIDELKTNSSSRGRRFIALKPFLLAVVVYRYWISFCCFERAAHHAIHLSAHARDPRSSTFRVFENFQF